MYKMESDVYCPECFYLNPNMPMINAFIDSFNEKQSLIARAQGNIFLEGTEFEKIRKSYMSIAAGLTTLISYTHKRSPSETKPVKDLDTLLGHKSKTIHESFFSIYEKNYPVREGAEITPEEYDIFNIPPEEFIDFLERDYEFFKKIRGLTADSPNLFSEAYKSNLKRALQINRATLLLFNLGEIPNIEMDALGKTLSKTIPNMEETKSKYLEQSKYYKAVLGRCLWP